MLEVKRTVPEVVWSRSEFVLVQLAWLIVGFESQQPKLVEVGDQHYPVLLEIAECLGAGCKGVKVVACGLDFDDAALGVLQLWRLGVARRAIGLGKEAAVGHACSLVAELGGEEDARLQSLADGVEEAV